MFSVICTEKNINQIVQAVGAGNVVFKKIVNKEDDFRRILEESARIHTDVLVLEADIPTDNSVFIETLRKYRIARPETRIIIIAPNRKAGDMLMAQIVKLGIYDIISPESNENDEVLLIPYIVEALDKPSVYTNAARWDVQIDEMQNSFQKKVKVVEKVVEKTIQRTVKQQIITFYTTDNNQSKDDILTQIAFLLASKSMQKILVIDMNSMLPTLDHFFGVDKEIFLKDIYDLNTVNTGLSAVYYAIEKNIFSSELLEEFTIKHKKFNNLYLLTGLYDMNLFSTLTTKHYETLIETAKESYDTIIINTNNDIGVVATYTALKNASIIIAVSGANYTYARNINTILNYLIDYHKIPKSKFKIIIDGLSKQSLNKDYLVKIFEEYEILGFLHFNPYREEVLNRQEGTPFILTSYSKKDIASYIEIIEKLGYIPKPETWFSKVFKKRKANLTAKGREEII
ncbi:MAG: hypothetical protein N2448_06445 [Caloramator sp.]|nr:hypothetical protein [Caloramator sp.]